MTNANNNNNIVDTITMNNTNDNDCNVKIGIGTTTPTCLSNAGTVTMANTALAQLAQSTTQYAFTHQQAWAGAPRAPLIDSFPPLRLVPLTPLRVIQLPLRTLLRMIDIGAMVP